MKLKQQGFTIVELMIATLVFSVVLMMATFGIIQVTRTYYKGLSENDTQTAARSITDTISRMIQFGGNAQVTAVTTPGEVASFCIGSQQFSYRLGWKVTDSTPVPTKHETPHAFYQKSSVANCGTPVDLTDTALAGGRELLSPNMRLAKLSVTQLAADKNLYEITVKVVYGDDDLLFSPSDNTASAPTKPDVRCADARAGTQFCAVSELKTIVEKRIM
jgi:prepilin-type N-terminal cleavage/methylation domain-containing protein